VGDHDLIVLLNNAPNADLGEMAKGIRGILFGKEPAAPKRALADVLGDTIVHRGVDAAVAQYRELKKGNPDAYELGEGSLNRLANLLMDNNRIADAIVILKLNVEEFPKASNSYARLAEAYEKSGQKQLAIENYRTAAELDPTDQDTKDKLKELEKN
jgi:tetratricopeptide (TPR) repeat protein